VCRANGGDLATISNDRELDGIVLHFGLPLYAAWIGLNDLANEGTFVWANRDSAGYRVWTPEEPNEATGGEDCVELIMKTKSWNDNNCGKLLYFLCEKVRKSPVICAHLFVLANFLTYTWLDVRPLNHLQALHLQIQPDQTILKKPRKLYQLVLWSRKHMKAMLL
jgi:hypothetical protein